eukprot:CAMPEP_0175283776 /NCGR_PEP_ID=MMETSP0093-20121207/52323_1 /TAXON_ID=311494 /ORGANISM="Alexandrium monilatum, Strain CCMP3105" /LENGTH=88 /DNA_ID=CAMNT_0016579023 /DNA_START=25 /DNA_END=287 /DNA_ORIENTATION=-
MPPYATCAALAGCARDRGVWHAVRSERASTRMSARVSTHASMHRGIIAQHNCLAWSVHALLVPPSCTKSFCSDCRVRRENGFPACVVV